MTKQDKNELIGTFIFSVVLYLLSKNVTFAVSLPLGGYVYYFLARRAFGASWLVRVDEEEAAFRKPLALRTLFGALALFSAWAVMEWVRVCMIGSEKTNFLVGVFGLIILALMTLLFLWSAGPMETRFDLRRGRVQCLVGLPLFARAHTWNADEIGSLRVLASRRAIMMSILWKRPHGLSGTSVSFRTSEEAQVAVEHIGKRLGLSVEVRQIR